MQCHNCEIRKISRLIIRPAYQLFISDVGVPYYDVWPRCEDSHSSIQPQNDVPTILVHIVNLIKRQHSTAALFHLVVIKCLCALIHGSWMEQKLKPSKLLKRKAQGKWIERELLGRRPTKKKLEDKTPSE